MLQKHMAICTSCSIVAAVLYKEPSEHFRAKLS